MDKVLVFQPLCQNPLVEHPWLKELWRTDDLRQMFAESMEAFFDGTEQDCSGQVLLIGYANPNADKLLPIGITGYWHLDDSCDVLGMRWTGISKERSGGNMLSQVAYSLLSGVFPLGRFLVEVTQTPEVVAQYLKSGFVPLEEVDDLIEFADLSRGNLLRSAGINQDNGETILVYDVCRYSGFKSKYKTVLLTESREPYKNTRR